MTTRGFGASTPRDLLERAKHEVAELDRAIQTYYLSEHEGRNKVGSLAAACAASLWNVVDWLARTSDPSSRAAVHAAGYLDYKSVRDYLKGASADLTLCWEVTNGVKHCELDGHTLKSSQID